MPELAPPTLHFARGVFASNIASTPPDTLLIAVLVNPVHVSVISKIPPTVHSTAQPGSPPVPVTISLSSPETNSSCVIQGRSTAFAVTLSLVVHEPAFSNVQPVAVTSVTKSKAPGPTVPSSVPVHLTAVPPLGAFKSDSKSEPTDLDLMLTGEVIAAPFNNHSGPANAAADPIAPIANRTTMARPNIFACFIVLNYSLSLEGWSTDFRWRSSFQVRGLRGRFLPPAGIPTGGTAFGTIPETIPCCQAQSRPMFLTRVHRLPRTHVEPGNPAQYSVPGLSEAPREGSAHSPGEDRPRPLVRPAADWWHSSSPTSALSPAIQRKTPDAPRRIWGMMQRIPSGSTPAGGW